MSDAEKILLIRLKSIGDILFTLPAVHRLRDNFPRARMSFLTSKEHAPILDGFAEVDETIALDRALFQQRRVKAIWARSEEHTSELQSHSDLVCRLLLEKKKKHKNKRS